MATAKIGTETVPLPGFGAMGMSAFYGSFDDKKNREVLKHAVATGATFWDTANIYGCGTNEELIASVLKDKDLRSKVFLATKFGGFQFDEKTRQFSGGPRGDPAYVKQCLADSIRRLGFTPDLFYQHRVDPNTPIEETVKAMEEERKAGRCRFLGLSECSAETLRKACKVAKIDACQLEYSPWETSIERNGLMDACKELGVAIVAYSPLGRGFLTGKYKGPEDFEEGDFRKGNPRFQKEAFEANLAIVHKLEEVAQKKGCSAGQLCLAWSIAQGCLPIPGTRDAGRLDENFAAGEITLSEEELKAIRKLVDEATIVGDRYQPQMMQSVNI